MDRERESPPERLPFCLDDTVGEIVRACQECPGVYYIAARKQDGRFLADEYYVVERSSPAISKEAMAYGRMSEEDSRVLLYPFAEERHGYKIIEYEIYRYQVRHGMYADGQTSLRDVAFFNMEYHPEYFGSYPAPLATPRGRTARYKPLMNGVFWIETGTGEEVLAVCYPIWNCDFSETVLKQSEQSEEDVREGIDNTLGYLFFSKRASSLALFELWGAVRGVKDWRPNQLPRIDELYLGLFSGVRRHIQYAESAGDARYLRPVDERTGDGGGIAEQPK